MLYFVVSCTPTPLLLLSMLAFLAPLRACFLCFLPTTRMRHGCPGAGSGSCVASAGA